MKVERFQELKKLYYTDQPHKEDEFFEIPLAEQEEFYDILHEIKECEK